MTIQEPVPSLSTDFSPLMADAPSRNRNSPEQPSPYLIQRSLRFNRPDSTELTRTFTAVGNRRLMTFSCWFKNSQQTPSLYMGIWGRNTQDMIGFGSSIMNFQVWAGNTLIRETRNQFRDPANWTHFIVVVDTANATADDRCIIYVNGRRVPNAELTTNAAVTINTDFGTWNTNVSHSLGGVNGTFSGSPGFLNGYLADVYFLDGVAARPESFGFFDRYGIWQPKRYDGACGGVNSYYLTFQDASNTTAATLGRDQWQDNNFTPNNFSVTPGAGNDSSVDTPTNNITTLNFLDTGTNTISNGSLDITNAGNWNGTRATQPFATKGKWYFEATTNGGGGPSNGIGVGVALASANRATTSNLVTGVWSLVTNGASFILQSNGTTAVSGLPNAVAGETIRVAWDANRRHLYLGRNGGWYNSAGTLIDNSNFPNSGTPTFDLSSVSGDLFPWFQNFARTLNINFGHRPFAYALPEGYHTLSQPNIQSVMPLPSVRPDEVFRPVTYTGNATARNIRTGMSQSRGAPSLVWIKNRSVASNHRIHDTRRGGGLNLISNATNAENTDSTQLTDFLTDAFALGTSAEVNTNANNYVAWCWQMSSCFDIVTYVGDGTANRVIPHSLGGRPEMAIVKNRDNASSGWFTWHRSLSSDTHFVALQGTSSETNSIPVFQAGGWRPAAFVVNDALNVNTNRYVAYLFRSIPGVCAVGSYIGNGAADGPYMHCGFEPSYVMIKRFTGGVMNWVTHDTARQPANPNNLILYPDTTSAEFTVAALDFTSSGIKIRTTDSAYNTGDSYLYLAMAARPQGARAR